MAAFLTTILNGSLLSARPIVKGHKKLQWEVEENSDAYAEHHVQFFWIPRNTFIDSYLYYQVQLAQICSQTTSKHYYETRLNGQISQAESTKTWMTVIS